MNYGAVKSPIDVRDYKIKTSSESLPEEYELPYTPEVKNQLSVSSCVAHVAASIEEYYEYLQCNQEVELSPGFIYGTRYEYVDKGMYLRDALKTLKEKGICTQDTFPYNEEVPKIINRLKNKPIEEKELSHHKISSYFRCNSIEDIKQAIYNYGPVMISIVWYKDNATKDGILKQKGDKDGNHCLYVYGWDKTGFKFMNSWGSWWGNNGKAILPYEYTIREAFGVTDMNLDNKYIHKPKRNKFLDFIYRIINWILNLFN